MTMKYLSSKPYPAYKDSGVKWLGKVPEHWDLQRMATVADIRLSNVDKHTKEGEHPVRLCNYIDVYHNERITVDIPFMAGTAKSEEIQKFRLAVGDVLVTKDSEDWKDIGVPALVEYAADDLICGYHLAILRPNEESLDGGYLFYALKELRVAWQSQVAAVGVTRYGLSQNAIRSVRIPLPPLSEQRAIAHFLDHANKRIQRYIHAKEKLIKLLEEQKRVIIHQAVTGQIDVRTGKPYLAYKDSGVEWLGEVPEHWDLVRLKHIARVQTGLTLGKNYKKTRTIFRPYLRVANVQTDCLDLTKVKSIDVSPDEANRATLLNEDVLMTEGGDINKLGRGCVWRDEIPNCLHQNHIFAVRCRQNILIPEFLVRLMASQYGRTYFQITAKQTTNLASTNSNILGAFPIPLPSIKDQLSVCHLISEETSALTNLVRQTEHQITLLHEYRTRLIADVVTGKLDVREAAAALPEKEPPTGGDNCQDGMAFAVQVQSRCP